MDGWVSTAKVNALKEQNQGACADEDQETRIKMLLDQPSVQDKIQCWIRQAFLVFVKARFKNQECLVQSLVILGPLKAL